MNGLLILGAGVFEYLQPPVEKVVLFDLHASIWWGAILAIIGAIYCVYYAPRKDRS